MTRPDPRRIEHAAALAAALLRADADGTATAATAASGASANPAGPAAASAPPEPSAPGEASFDADSNSPYSQPPSGWEGNKPEPPLRKRSRQVIWAALALAVLVLAAAIGFVVHERSNAESAALSSVDLYAKVLEDQTTRVMSSADTILRSLAENLENIEGEPDALRHGILFADSLRRQPFLRSLSLLDAQGQVLVSSSAQNTGLVLPLKRLGDLPDASTPTRLGPLLAGRDVADLRDDDPATSPVNSLPLVRRLERPNSGAMYLVALISPEYFATEHSRLVGDTGLRVGLLGYGGRMLVAGEGLTQPPGAAMGPLLLVFREFLPTREHSAYIGDGINGDTVVTAFRTSRQWPLVVVVEMTYSKVSDRIVAAAQLAAGLALALWLLITVTTVVLARSLRTDETRALQLQELFESRIAIESRRRAMLETSVDAIITINAQGLVVDFNPAAERIFGRRADTVLDQPVHDFIVPPSMREAHVNGLGGYIRGDNPGPVLNKRIEVEAMRADGTLFPIELTVVPVRAGRELFFTATLRDITERRQIEAERASMLQRYRALATDLERQKLALDEHAIVSISDAQGRILYANDKLVQASGFSREELLGRQHSLLKSGRQPASLYQDLWGTITQGRIWHGELVNKARSGQLYWVASTIVPVPGDDGKPRQYISIQTDISALRQAEMALAEAQRRDREIGARIQQSLLVTPPGAQLPGLWISAYNHASQGIDGDFVEVIRIGDHCVDIVTGDVMGKGIAAALMGAATKLQFSRSIAELLARARSTGALPQPAEIVSAVHHAMTPHLQALEAFVTLCHIRIDTIRHTVTWVGCGHEEPLVLRTQGGHTRLVNQHPPLGVLDLTDYEQGQTVLLPGDSLFLCSDGVTDALRSDGERVGRDRVNWAVEHLVKRHATPGAVLHSLRRVLFQDKVQLNDDVTMVMITRPPDNKGRQERLEMPARIDSLHDLREFVHSQCQLAGLSDHEVGLLEVAAVEAFTNIVRHTLDRLEDSTVEALSRITATELTLELIHLGTAFSPPDEIPDTDFSAFPEGGFGLTIIRNACDRVDYLHSGGVNTIRMLRFRPPPIHLG